MTTASPLRRKLALLSVSSLLTLALAQNDYLHTQEMMDACEQRGFQCLQLQADLERHFEASLGRPFEWKRYKDSDLVVSAGNLHPSVLQHAMAAKKVLTHLEQAGLLERWMAER